MYRENVGFTVIQNFAMSVITNHYQVLDNLQMKAVVVSMNLCTSIHLIGGGETSLILIKRARGSLCIDGFGDKVSFLGEINNIPLENRNP